MKILLDTHIFLWALAEPEKLNAKARAMLETRANTIYVSAITVAELTIKASLGKLLLPFNPVEMIECSGFEMLDFSGNDALRLQNMPFHHRDPFDRMLIAQALARELYLMSRDEKFMAYGCKLI